MATTTRARSFPGPRGRRAGRPRVPAGSREALLAAGTELFAERGFDGVVPWRATVTSRFLREARAAGIFVAPWTVNRPKDMEFFGKAECDVIITDVPHVLREHLQSQSRVKLCSG